MLHGVRSSSQGKKDGPRGPSPGPEGRVLSGNKRRGERSAPKTPRALGNDLFSGGDPLGNQSLYALGPPAPSGAHKEIPHTTNQLERVSKEIKRQTKGVEVFWGEEAVEKLLYLVLSNLHE